MQARIANFGYTAFASSPAEFGKFIAEDIQKWAKVVKFAGIRPD
jgi:tripartite-type tricarboxylate transporter receptor subunit TctC